MKKDEIPYLKDFDMSLNAEGLESWDLADHWEETDEDDKKYVDDWEGVDNADEDEGEYVNKEDYADDNSEYEGEEYAADSEYKNEEDLKYADAEDEKNDEYEDARGRRTRRGGKRRAVAVATQAAIRGKKGFYSRIFSRKKNAFQTAKHTAQKVIKQTGSKKIAGKAASFAKKLVIQGTHPQIAHDAAMGRAARVTSKNVQTAVAIKSAIRTLLTVV